MSRRSTRILGPNRFKLGLFGMNCSNGLTMTKAPERWEASFENNVAAARLADEAGLEFALPIGRWHGYKGETDTEGSSFETLTWATGLLAATKDLCVCGTLHVAFHNPVFAAKQMVTADHVGQGRFGLNIVSGWNQGEFDMFGIALKDHESRYEYTGEWIDVVRRIWTAAEPFDYDGKYFHLKGVLGKPKPWFPEPPILISAGVSPTGRAFAARNVDCQFMAIGLFETLKSETEGVRAIARAAGKECGIFASGHMVARATEKEARDYYHYIVYDTGDWEAAEHAAEIRLRGRTDKSPLQIQEFKERLISGVGTYPVVGSYDGVVEQFARMSEGGLDGMAVGLVNYIAEFPRLRDEVLPRMVRAGLRLA